MKKKIQTFGDVQDKQRTKDEAKAAKSAERGALGKWWHNETPAQKYLAMFGHGGEWANVQGFEMKTMKKGQFKPTKFSTKGMSAEVVAGENIGDYVSAARIGGATLAGGVLFGPLGIAGGAVLGALFKKNHNKVYVVVKYNGEVVGTLEDSARKKAKAEEFADALNGSASDPANQ